MNLTSIPPFLPAPLRGSTLFNTEMEKETRYKNHNHTFDKENHPLAEVRWSKGKRYQMWTKYSLAHLFNLEWQLNIRVTHDGYGACKSRICCIKQTKNAFGLILSSFSSSNYSKRAVLLFVLDSRTPSLYWEASLSLWT